MVRLLRQLSAVYLVAAGLYSSMVVLNARPELARDLRSVATEAGRQGAEVADAAANWTRTEGVALVSRAVAWVQEKRVQLAAKKAEPKPPVIAAAPRAPVTVRALPAPEIAKPAPEPRFVLSPSIVKPIVPRRFALKLPPLPRERAPVMAEAPPLRESLPPRLELVQPQEPEFIPQETPPPSAGEIARVAERLRANLTGELFSHFDLFLYVSKAERGPWAQRMYVFDKRAGRDLALLHAWPVSTGRPARALTNHGVRYALDTPSGYYQLDHNRFHVRYTSAEWGMPMPHAMFFNWVKNGNQTGFAIHGVMGEDVALLGTRASAGCIRLAPENAKVLFNLIKANYRGAVPRFATDTKTGTMNSDGILWRNRNGELRMNEGYRVLVFVENYGGEDVVAMLY